VGNIGDYAFNSFSSLTNVAIPNSVISIGSAVFGDCAMLKEVFFKGERPLMGANVFYSSTNATVYYLPGTGAWNQWPSPPLAVLWNPAPLNPAVQADQLGFAITGTPNIPIVVEATTGLVSANWTALQTCTLTNGSIYFSDPDWTKHPARLYRIRSP
jgi:hypothetical protein